jgi:hypothetical protein
MFSITYQTAYSKYSSYKTSKIHYILTKKTNSQNIQKIKEFLDASKNDLITQTDTRIYDRTQYTHIYKNTKEICMKMTSDNKDYAYYSNFRRYFNNKSLYIHISDLRYLDKLKYFTAGTILNDTIYFL